jgi:uncharacterized protein with ParB-like and HNH nuclease domain
VDGQQRLISISLMLCALGDLICDSQPDLNRRIRRLLTNDQEKGILFFKLVPTKKYGDRETYFALLRKEEISTTLDSKIPEAHEFFYKEFGNRLKSGALDPTRLFLVLVNCLQVVFIDLDQGERPYEIFESLNAKNKPLTQADLVRNYIAMKLTEARQEEVFEKHWSHIEELLQDKRLVGHSGLGELTAFLRHYITMRAGVLCNERHVYERFRDRMEEETSNLDEFIQEIIILKKFAGYYNRLLRPENEPNLDIRNKLRRLNILEVSTAFPFLMMAYEAYDGNGLSAQEFCEVLDIIENYIVRRYLTSEPTNYLNKMFPTLWREISPAKVVETLRKVIITKNYPADTTIQRELSHARLYGRGSQVREKLVLVLETINRHLDVAAGGYTVLNDIPTIEHIMPQSLSPAWKAHLGINWEQIYKDYLDTIGNLTLVTQEWNNELSNAPFEEKKGRLAGHALKLNRSYFSQDSVVKWNDTAILERAEYLVKQILSLWPELGTPPVNQKTTGKKPISLTILGQSFLVSTWREVAYQTTVVASQLVDNFETAIAEQMPAYFDQHEYKNACRQLPNGWWLYLNLSAASVKNFCHNIIILAGLSDEDWVLEEE